MKKGRKSENGLTSPASKMAKVSTPSEVKVKTPKPLTKTTKSNIETPKPDKSPKAEKTPIIKATPKVEKTPKAAKTPKVEKSPTPLIKATPKGDKTPKVEKTTKAEKTPIVKATPKVEKTPKAEKAPQVDKTPKSNKAAKAEKTPKVKTPPKVAKTPKAAKTPTVLATPKSEVKKEKVSKTPKQLNGTPATKNVESSPKKVIVVPEKSTLDKKQVAAFVDALFKLHEKKIVKAGSKVSKDKLFDDDETERINLLVSSIKLPSDKRHQILSIELPNAILPEPTEVCLIVKDLQKGLTVDHEPTTIHFRDILSEKGIGPDFISTVMPLRELKVEYKAYETKTALCHKFDAFLADDCIVRLLPQFLGKAFYKRKKFPRSVNLKAKDLKVEFTRALRTTTLPLNHHGTSAMVQIGHVGMTKEQVGQNLMKVTEILEKRFPGGWKNIRSIHIKTEKSLAIPMYMSEVPVNEIGYVDASLPKRKAMEEVTDELSTRPGLEVTVHKSGRLRIKKKPDPNWDSTRDECLSEASDEDEESDAEDDKEKKKKKPVAKKEKKEAKKRPNKDASAEAEQNGKKKKQKKSKVDADEKDSEDEEMERAEQKYLKRQAEEEETEPQEKASKKAKNEEEEVIEDDEGSNGEESESFDDDQEIDAKDVILDSNDEDEESDEDADLVLKNKPQHFDEELDAENTAKPKHVKKTKKMRRMEVKKQKAASPGGKGQKSNNGPHKKRGKK